MEIPGGGRRRSQQEEDAADTPRSFVPGSGPTGGSHDWGGRSGSGSQELEARLQAATRKLSPTHGVAAAAGWTREERLIRLGENRKDAAGNPGRMFKAVIPAVPSGRPRITINQALVDVFVPDSKSYTPIRVNEFNYGTKYLQPNGQKVDAVMRCLAPFDFYPPIIFGQTVPLQYRERAKQAVDPHKRVHWVSGEKPLPDSLILVKPIPRFRRDHYIEMEEEMKKPEELREWVPKAGPAKFEVLPTQARVGAGYHTLPEKTQQNVTYFDYTQGKQVTKQMWGYNMTINFPERSGYIPQGQIEISRGSAAVWAAMGRLGKKTKKYGPQTVTIKSDAVTQFIPIYPEYRPIPVKPVRTWAPVVCEDGSVNELRMDNSEYTFWPPRFPGQTVPAQYREISNPRKNPTGRVFSAQAPEPINPIPKQYDYIGFQPGNPPAATPQARGHWEIVNWPPVVFDVSDGTIAHPENANIRLAYKRQSTAAKFAPERLFINDGPVYKSTYMVPPKVFSYQLKCSDGSFRTFRQETIRQFGPRGLLMFLHWPIPVPGQQIKPEDRGMANVRNASRTIRVDSEGRPYNHGELPVKPEATEHTAELRRAARKKRWDSGHIQHYARTQSHQFELAGVPAKRAESHAGRPRSQSEVPFWVPQRFDPSPTPGRQRTASRSRSASEPANVPEAASPATEPSASTGSSGSAEGAAGGAPA